MTTISSQLRSTKEPTKEENLRLFFSLPINPAPEDEKAQAYKMDISAVISLPTDSQEDSYVSTSIQGPPKSVGKVVCAVLTVHCRQGDYASFRLIWHFILWIEEV
jgi:hypothetical protein